MKRTAIKISFLAVILTFALPICNYADDTSTVRKNGPQRQYRPAFTGNYEAGRISPDDIPAGAVKLGFSEAIVMAIERNLQLQAEADGARANAASLKSTYSLYDPVLSAEFFTGSNNDLFNSLFVTTLEPTESQYRNARISLSQNLPIGTQLILSATQLRDDAEPAPAVNPSYDSQATLSLVQPLMKGFGPTTFGRQIRFAAKDKQVAIQDLREVAFDVVAAVRNAYLDTLQAQYELSYRETSVELARRIVRENVARVEAGILPPVEKLEAEVGLQTRERLLLDARRAYADALDRFNLLLDADDKNEYLPIIEDFSMTYETSEDIGIESAMLRRPDVQRRMSEIEKIGIERSVARNALLPELDLVASYSQNGLSDSAGSAFDSVRDGDYDSWELGLRFSYPLGSIAGRNNLQNVELRLRQERALLRQLHNDVRNQVRSAIRAIEVSRKKTEVAERGHELASEKLRILLKSREVGLATTRDVLDGEEDLASARTEQIASVADYFKALTEYLRVTGMLLESEGVIFEGDVTPAREQIPFYIR